MQVEFPSYGHTGDLGVRTKGKISLNLSYHVNFKDFFIPNFMRVLTNKRKYFEQNFYSVAGVMPKGWDVGC